MAGVLEDKDRMTDRLLRSYRSHLLACCMCERVVKRTGSPLSTECFTFVREPIYHEPNEVVRMAGVPNVAGRHRHTKARTAPGVTSTMAQLSAGVDSSKTQTGVASVDHQNKPESKPPPG